MLGHTTRGYAAHLGQYRCHPDNERHRIHALNLRARSALQRSCSTIAAARRGEHGSTGNGSKSASTDTLSYLAGAHSRTCRLATCTERTSPPQTYPCSRSSRISAAIRAQPNRIQVGSREAKRSAHLCKRVIDACSLQELRELRQQRAVFVRNRCRVGPVTHRRALSINARLTA